MEEVAAVAHAPLHHMFFALLLATNALQVSVRSDGKHAPMVLDTFLGTYRTGEADISRNMKTGMTIKLAGARDVETGLLERATSRPHDQSNT